MVIYHHELKFNKKKKEKKKERKKGVIFMINVKVIVGVHIIEIRSEKN